ncbi:MAG: DNA gyrase inhibitor YacG [Ahrensia sp.]|nr:DNA gyrase inhibitor YacG [Ahrensia sp.]
MSRGQQKDAVEQTVAPLRKAVPCPQCAQPSRRESYPFCSRRCAQLDLGNWFDGRYRLSTGQDDQGSASE